MTGLAEIWQDLARARHHNIGFPVAVDVSFTDLLPFQGACWVGRAARCQ